MKASDALALTAFERHINMEGRTIGIDRAAGVLDTPLLFTDSAAHSGFCASQNLDCKRIDFAINAKTFKLAIGVPREM